jgi:ribonuclease Z
VHTVKIYGFIIKEADRLHFMKEKCAKLGMRGIMFKKIMKDGSIKLGKREIKLKDVTLLKRGVKIIYAVDTRPSRNTVKAAKGADAIIHEATYSDDLRDMAVERKHSTAAEAATVAKKAHAKLLVLTHISARYKNAGVILKEARSIFKNTILAKDGLRLVIRGP